MIRRPARSLWPINRKNTVPIRSIPDRTLYQTVLRPCKLMLLVGYQIDGFLPCTGFNGNIIGEPPPVNALHALKLLKLSGKPLLQRTSIVRTYN